MKIIIALFLIYLPTVQAQINPRYEQIQNIFNAFNKDAAPILGDFYDDEIEFHDSVGSIKGLKELTKYYVSLYQNVKSIKFDFSHYYQKDNNYVVYWTMTYAVDALNGGQDIVVPGNSEIRYSEKTNKVIYHRDYFDAGAMVYEHVPVLGYFVRNIKNRLKH